MFNIVSAVPTHIITGFLGAGKTSAILHLLKSKPADQRWAVLVNEFGEVGVDGHLFEAQYSERQRVFVREVPGGCMCCAAGLPMQVALNQLLAQAKPDRLLIEPTGLGHPKEVLQVLSSEYYREVLDVQKVLTLVDARHVSDERYTSHAIFNQQIAIADIVIGNKQDLYQPEDKVKLEEYVKQYGVAGTQVVFTQQGEIAVNDCVGKTAASVHGHLHDADHASTDLSSAPIPECGYLKAHNQGEGYHSIGWRFSSDWVFDRQKLLLFLKGIQANRMKAVLMTQEGVFGYQLTSDGLTEIDLNEHDRNSADSRIEVIAEYVDQRWEAQLYACRAHYQPKVHY